MQNQRDGYAGTLLLYHPLIDEDDHNLYDKNYREGCCREDLVVRTLCDEYFDSRPVNPGDVNLEPAMGVGKFIMRHNTICSLNPCKISILVWYM